MTLNIKYVNLEFIKVEHNDVKGVLSNLLH